MVVIGPVSVSMPSYLSKEQLTGALGCAGGIVFSDFLAASLISRLGWTGGTALAAASAAKIGLGTLTWYGATKMTGALAKPLMGLASVGCFASVIIDVTRYVWPMIGGASARLQAATRRVAARPVAAAPAVRVGPPVGVRIRAETPEAYSLGGF